jgi:hypothetical protein
MWRTQDVSRRRTTRTVERVPARDGRPPLELVRSTRRRRTVSAFPRDGVIVVQLPAGMAHDDEHRIVTQLVDKVTGRLRAERVDGDDALASRAADLADRYLDGIRPASVTWSDRMRRRWASCSQVDGTIRVSRRLATMPDYVLDAVLVHELAHLQSHAHGPDFQALVARYEHTDRARGFLEGLQHAAARASLDDPDLPAGVAGLDDDLTDDTDDGDDADRPGDVADPPGGVTDPGPLRPAASPGGALGQPSLLGASPSDASSGSSSPEPPRPA